MSYSQLPGTLNLLLKSGDNAETVIDFDVSLSGRTVTSHIYSLVTHDKVADITTTVVDAAAGQVGISFASQTTPVGSYGWSMQWVSAGGAKRTALSGVCEVVK